MLRRRARQIARPKRSQSLERAGVLRQQIRMIRAVHAEAARGPRAWAATLLSALLLIGAFLQPLAGAAMAGPDAFGRWPICSGGELIYLSDAAAEAAWQGDESPASEPSATDAAPLCPLAVALALTSEPTSPAIPAERLARRLEIPGGVDAAAIAPRLGAWARAPPRRA